MNETLKAWAAGVFDGEGSALIEARKNDCYQIFVSVASTDSRVTDPFREYWNGKYHRNKPLSECKYKDGSKRKDEYTVWFDRDDAIRLLTDIIPYLKAQQDRAIVVLKALYALKREATARGIRGASRIIRPYHEELREVYIPTKGKKGPNKAGLPI